MFLLRISDVMEEHVNALTRIALQESLLTRAETVWGVREEGTEEELCLESVHVGQLLRVRTGSSVPVDGILAVTRNITKATSVLMVDYSCAIKLSTPVAVMSAMREASSRGCVVKGGKFLESMAAADITVTNCQLVGPHVCCKVAYVQDAARKRRRAGRGYRERFEARFRIARRLSRGHR